MSDSALSSDTNEDRDRLYRDTGGRALPTGGVWAAARARRAQRMLDADAGQPRPSLAVSPAMPVQGTQTPETTPLPPTSDSGSDMYDDPGHYTQKPVIVSRVDVIRQAHTNTHSVPEPHDASNDAFDEASTLVNQSPTELSSDLAMHTRKRPSLGESRSRPSPQPTPQPIRSNFI